MARPIRIDIFTDIICPWCLIGTARLDAAIAEQDAETEVTVHHHPFLLDPDTPAAGQNTRERLAAKYGGDIDAMQARVEVAARDAGVPLDLSVQPMSYPTIAAHTLIRHAPEWQRYGLAKAYAQTYFIEGRNIADTVILSAIAAEYGVPHETALALLQDEEEAAATRAEAMMASEQGITGVPFFIFANQFGLSGAQPAEVFARAFRLARGEETLPAQSG